MDWSGALVRTRRVGVFRHSGEAQAYINLLQRQPAPGEYYRIYSVHTEPVQSKDSDQR